MSGIVVDASVTLSWCFPDERSAFSVGVLNRLKVGGPALVPAFWCIEVLNALLVGEKRGRITRGETQSFLDELWTLNPVLDEASLELVCGVVQTISREHGITPYDALYIELAVRRRCPLATLDQRQREAAVA